MGYSYDFHNRLCCDKCGHSGGVRKRTCPYKVLGDSLRTPGGNRYTMNYCYPPALCAACYKQLGGLRGVHGDSCKEGAAKSQAEDDAIEAALDAGEMFVVSATGDWQEDVPEGMVLVTFWSRYNPETRTRPEVKRLVAKDDYQPTARPRLSDYPTAIAA